MLNTKLDSSLQGSPILRSEQEWNLQFSDFGLSSSRVETLSEYAGSILAQDVPVIFSFRHLCRLLGKDPSYLASVIFSPESHYRTFSIPKRSGGEREICAPYPALLECQRWITANILGRRKAHFASHGYVSKKSILSNAKVHRGQEELLKIDIRDFFPSIRIDRVIGIFKSFGYVPEIAFFLAKICTLYDRLPQGAATSPALSNICFFHLDKRLLALAESRKLRYSRYADDLAFSGSGISLSLSNSVASILDEEKFEVHPAKLVLIRAGRRKIVTGIDVTTRSIRVPREYRRAVRQQANLAIKLGALNYIAQGGIGKRSLAILQGKLQYWVSVEPRNDFAKYSLNQINDMCRRFL